MTTQPTTAPARGPESVHARLDREIARLTDDQVDSVTRVSESFIAGVEYAANIAYRMSGEPTPAAEPKLGDGLIDTLGEPMTGQTTPKPHYSMDPLELALAQRDEARAEALRFRVLLRDVVITFAIGEVPEAVGTPPRIRGVIAQIEEALSQ